jgi:hypothetical protein
MSTRNSRLALDMDKSGGLAALGSPSGKGSLKPPSSPATGSRSARKKYAEYSFEEESEVPAEEPSLTMTVTVSEAKQLFHVIEDK